MGMYPVGAFDYDGRGSPRKARWELVAGLLGGLGVAVPLMYVFILSEVTDYFGVSEWFGSLLVTAVGLGYGASMVFLAPWADRVDRRTLSCLRLALAGLIIITAGLTKNFGLALVLNLVAGALAGLDPVLRALLESLLRVAFQSGPRDAARELMERGRQSAVVTGGYLAGLFGARPVIAFLGWPNGIIAFGAVLVLASIPGYLMLPRDPEGASITALMRRSRDRSGSLVDRMRSGFRNVGSTLKNEFARPVVRVALTHQVLTGLAWGVIATPQQVLLKSHGLGPSWVVFIGFSVLLGGVWSLIFVPFGGKSWAASAGNAGQLASCVIFALISFAPSALYAGVVFVIAFIVAEAATITTVIAALARAKGGTATKALLLGIREFLIAAAGLPILAMYSWLLASPLAGYRDVFVAGVAAILLLLGVRAARRLGTFVE